MSLKIEDLNISRHTTDDFKDKDQVVAEKDNLFRSAQHKLLNVIAVREGFTDYDIETTLIPNNGGNYLGILYKAFIRSKQLKAGELRLFVKIAADSEQLRKVLPLHDVYCNEVFAYKVLSRLYNNLQEDANVPETQMFRFTKFYGSIETKYVETIVLDNLSYKNYIVENRFECITLEFAKSAIDNMAKFHTLSYVLQRRDPVYFDEVIKLKRGNIYIDGEGPQRMKEHSSNLTANALKNLQNKEYSERLGNFCESMITNIHQYVKTNKYPVLCHGDYRGNNLLVKYEREKITSLIPIDYQLIHYGSPLNDLIYFIFTTTDREFRKLHMDYLIEYYYECLGDFLRFFSYDVAHVYPKEDFDVEVKDHMMFGLVIGVHLLPFLLVSEENAPDLKEMDESTFETVIQQRPNDVFIHRYNDIIEDFVSWGYI